MSAKSRLAQHGIRFGTLGALASLAIAFPLVDGVDSPDAHTDANRIGFYASRAPTAEKLSIVVMGTEALAVTVTGVTLPVGAGLGKVLTSDAGGKASWQTPVIGGSIAANQVAYGASAGVLAGAAGLTYTGAYFRISANSSVVVQTLPTGTLSILTGADDVDARFLVGSYGTGKTAISGRHARGTNAAPTATQAGDIMSEYGAWGYGATGFSSAPRAMIQLFAAENWTDAAQGTRIGFYTTALLGVVTTEKVRIWGNGGVQIGGAFAASPGASCFSVAGKSFFAAAAAGYASINVAPGVDVTTPVEGDLWYVSSAHALKFYDGTTKVTVSAQVMTRTVLLRGQVQAGVVTGAQSINLASHIAGTIVGWRVTTDVATTASLDVWKRNVANPTVANTIVAAAPPVLSSAAYAASTTLTGWTTTVAVGDVFELNVASNSAAKVITLELDVLVG